MRLLNSIILPALLAAGVASSRPASTTATEAGAPAAPAASPEIVPADPREVLAHFHHEDEVEAEEARLALKSAHDPQVHSFAKVLIADHIACDRMLDDYARAHDIDDAGSSADGEGDGEFLAHLRTLSGPDFDRAFARHIYESHVQQIDELLQTRARIEDQKLRNVLTRIKPKLDQHKNTARSILRRLEAQQAER